MNDFNSLALSEIAAIADANAEFLEAMADEHPPGPARQMFQNWAQNLKEIAVEQKSWINANFDPRIKSKEEILAAYRNVTSLSPAKSERTYVPEDIDPHLKDLGLF